jgi:hypothetical protein
MRRTLTDLMDEVSGRNRDGSSPQDLGFDRVTVAAAWLASDNPLAMLLLLAALHSRREEEKCLALATELSFFEPMRVEARTMSRRRGGMHVDGRCPFYFIQLYQGLRAALRVIEDTLTRVTSAPTAPTSPAPSDRGTPLFLTAPQ